MNSQNAQCQTVHCQLKDDPKISEFDLMNRNLMKEIWVNDSPKGERLALISEIVHQIVGDAVNPFVALLDLHRYSCDYSVENDDRIASHILSSFDSWINKRDDREKFEENYINTDLQKFAFDVAINGTTPSLNKIFKIFRISRKNTENFMEVEPQLESFLSTQIQLFCEKLEFQKALEVADLLQWHEKFPIELFVVPCFIQNQALSLVESFLKKSPEECRLEFIQRLDSFVPLTKQQVNERLNYYRQMGMAPIVERFLDKTLERTIYHLLRFFEISHVYAPNFTRARVNGQMRYLLKKFNEASQSFESRYKNFLLLYNIVKTEDQWKCDLIYFVLGNQWSRQYHERALWWTMMLNAENADWLPDSLKNIIKFNSLTTNRIKNEVDSYRFQIDQQNAERIPEFLHKDYPIHLVDSTKLELFQQLPELFRKEQLLAFDAEWEQGILSDNLSLLQVASSKCVFLIDVISLLSCTTSAQWRCLLEALFTGDAIKIGFSFAQDFKNLSETFPEMNDLKTKFTKVICLQSLKNKIHSVNSQLILTTDNQSLVGLYKSVVGKTLDKTQQTSSWAHRPLNSKQILYSARDAYCLLEIYSELKRRTEAAGLDFESILFKPMKVEKERKHQESNIIEEIEKLTKNMSEYAASTGNQMRECGELKLIADKSLSGQAKYLRQLGVDVLLSSTVLTVNQLAKRYPDRSIISTGEAYTKLSQNQALADRVFCLPAKSPRVVMANFVFEHFNIQPKQSDIFSRCVECNNRSFVLVPRPVLHFIHHFSLDIKSVYAKKEDFIVEDWLKTLNDLSAEKFGVEAKVIVNQYPYDVVVKCVNGEIDLKRRKVKVENGNQVLIKLPKCTPDFFHSTEVPFFYVCGSCGQIYWNEYQKKSEKVDD